jgi:hypothetical protein
VANLSTTVSTPEDAANLPVGERAALATATLGSLTPDEQQSVIEQAGVRPDQRTSNYVWRVIVSAFAAALLVAVLVVGGIALGLFKGTTDIQTMLTIFTTAAGFLAGLLSPSPVGR